MRAWCLAVLLLVVVGCGKECPTAPVVMPDDDDDDREFTNPPCDSLAVPWWYKPRGGK